MNEEGSGLNGRGGAVTAVLNEELQAGWLREWRSALSSDFIRKVMETYATRVLLIGIGLVSAVIVARLLGPQGRGFYAVAAATGALGVQFGNLGLHTANVYFVARDPHSLAPLAGNSLAVSFGLGGLISVILAAVFLLFPNLTSLRGSILFLALAWIPFGLAYLLMQSLLLGVHDVRGYNLVEVASKVLPIVLIGGLVLTRRGGISTFFATGLVALVVGCIWMWGRLRVRFVGGLSLSLPLFSGSIRYAAKAYLAAFFAFLVLRADLFMVGQMLGAEQAGYYSVASSMADYVSVLAAVVGTILFPKLSAMTEIGAKLRLTQRAVWGTVGLLLPLLAVASLAAKPAVNLLFGAAFLPTSLAFVLLMPGMLFLGINTVAVQFLNSIGYPKSVVIIWGLCSIFNICLNLWVIPHYGIAGAAVVSSGSYFMAFFFILMVIRRTGKQFREGGLNADQSPA
jgi:O-antigen/teichoic acid export membrane protein